MRDRGTTDREVWLEERYKLGNDVVGRYQRCLLLERLLVRSDNLLMISLVFPN
jgi:hypothetical protein